MKRIGTILSNQRRLGDKHPLWKGGLKIQNGRMRIYVGKEKYEIYAKYVMENYLGRKLDKNEVVHHINENPMDDRIENLLVMTRSQHIALHNRSRKGRKYAKKH